MKTNFSIYLLIFAVLVAVVCMSIFTACKDKDDPTEEEKKEVPDPNAAPSGFDYKKDGVAYGTLTEKSYYSNTTKATRKCFVFTPAGYDPTLTYPVIYLLHGIGGTHTEWKDGGQPNEILSNLISTDEAKPMIAVMPNVRAMKDDSVPTDQYGSANVNAFNNFINDLKNDLMPFIQKEYKVSNERTGRAIAGLSMGGMESIYIGISMPETFGYIGAFSAAPGLPLTADKMTLPAEYKDNTFIMICCALDDGLISFSENYNKSLVDNGVQTTYYTLKKGGHGFDVWKNGLYHFAKSIF